MTTSASATRRRKRRAVRRPELRTNIMIVAIFAIVIAVMVVTLLR